MKKQKVVFLDRDGVINEQALPHEYVYEWKDFKVLPNVCKAIKKINENKYRVFVVSNQRGIARGKCNREQIDRLHDAMIDYFRKYNCLIDGVYVCPHDEGECNCRKPDIGLFMQVEDDLRLKEVMIDKEQSWMIGDLDTDIIAGHLYGVKTVRIITNRVESKKIEVNSELYASSLYDAVCKLLK